MNIRMSTKGKRPLRSLTPSDKIHAIERIHDGESKASVARDIGVPESTLRGWCKNEDKLRFMSRQTSVEQISSDLLTERIDSNCAGLKNCLEKRPKLEQGTMPINFSNKLKLDDPAYKGGSNNALDYSRSKVLSDLNFNGLPPDYASFNGGIKNKVFGADTSRSSNPSIAAISPLSSLSHLSGLASISQSPLAISFNEFTSNLHFLAQLSPGIAAVPSLNGLTSSASTVRKVKLKNQLRNPSPGNELGSDKKPGLSVKNWAKQQKNLTSSDDFSVNLNETSVRNKTKCMSTALGPTQNLPLIPPLPDDPLIYWLKSQQSILGVNTFYPPSSLDATISPVRPTSPQQSNHQTNPAVISPSMASSLSCSLEERNNAWLAWCKAFEASLKSIPPPSGTRRHTPPTPLQDSPPTIETEANQINDISKPSFENILYEHLTKDSRSPSTRSSLSENLTTNNGTSISNEYKGSRPEDLSARDNISPQNTSIKTSTSTSSPSSKITVCTPASSPVLHKVDIIAAVTPNSGRSSVEDCKDVLEDLICKINCNENSPLICSIESGLDSNDSYRSDHAHNNNEICTNNNNSNKTDEEEKFIWRKRDEFRDLEAIRQGENFLKWLESSSNPKVTAVQLMQLRFLISAVKTSVETIEVTSKSECITTSKELPTKVEESKEEEKNRCKSRRRK